MRWSYQHHVVLSKDLCEVVVKVGLEIKNGGKVWWVFKVFN